MAERLLKKKPHKVASRRAQIPAELDGRAACPHAAADGRTSAAIVGTYKKKQLAWIKRHGIYNYPVREEDFSRVEHVDRVDGEKGAEGFQSVKELWLYADTKGTRHVFEARYVGKMTRKEFRAANPTYAKLGASTNEAYYVFKTKFLEYGSRLDDPIVIARTADFGGRSAKVKKAIEQFKADGEFAPLTHYLPADLSKVPRSRLRVSEAAVQLDFWTNGVSVCCSPAEEQLHSTESISVSFHNDLGTLYLGDTLAWLRGLPSSSVNMIFADPPYSIGKADWDCFKSHEDYLKWCEAWIEQVSRILTERGTCYICGFSEILADVKYRTQRFFNGCRWIVWHYKNKANLGMDWGRSHESLLHFRKSKSTVLNVDDIRIPYNAHTLKYPAHPQADSSVYAKARTSKHVSQWHPNENGAKPKDVFDIPTTCNGMGEKTPHPTQKPEELVRKLVLASSCEGDLVLDPFSGSGTTAVVAQQLHRRWLACERVPEYNQWAIQRLIHVPDKPVQYWIDLDREVAKRRESIR